MRRYLLQYLYTISSKRFLTPPRKIHCVDFKGDVDINVFPRYYAQQFFYCVSYRQYLSRPTQIDSESTRVFYYSAVLVDNYIVSLHK